MIETPYSVTDLIQMIDISVQKFQPKWENARDNKRRWFAENWTPEMQQKHRNQGRQAFSMAVVLSKLHQISNVKKKSSSTWEVTPSQDPADEIKAILATLKLKDVAKSSKWNFRQNEVFEDALGILFGASKIYIDYDKYGNEIIKVRRVSWEDLIWDANSREYNVREDALWMSEVEKIYRRDLKIEYPEAENISEGNYLSFLGHETINYYITRHANNEEDFDVISKFNFYIKSPKTIYCIIHEDPLNFHSNGSNIIYEEFRSKKKAEERLREINLPYALQSDLGWIGEIRKKDNQVKLDRYVLTYNRILEYEETDLDTFPYDVNFAIRMDDEFISYQDFMKSPQKFYDRLWSQIDYSIGTDLKKVHQIYEDMLSERNPADQAKVTAEKGGTLFVKGPPGADVIKTIEGKGAPYQMFEIAGIMQGLIEDLGGGRSFSGLADDAGESGRAIRLKQQQGFMIAYGLVFNFQRYMQNLGENLLSWIKKFGSIDRTIRVSGDELTPEMIELLRKNNVFNESAVFDGGYAKLSDPNNELTFLQDAEFELEVKDSELSDEEKLIKRQQLAELMNFDPLLTESDTLKKEIFSTFDLENSKIQRIIEERNQAQQAQVEAANQQQQLEAAKVMMPLIENQQNNRVKLIEGKSKEKNSKGK